MSRLMTYLLIQQSKNKRKTTTSHFHHNRKLWGFGFLTVFLTGFILIPVIIGLYYSTITKELPSVEWLDILLNPKNGTLLTPTTIYARDEQTIIYQLQNASIPRRFLAVDPNSEEFFSPYLVQFTVSEYQPDFWQQSNKLSWWLDFNSTPTIAERLVERLLLWQEPETKSNTIRKKILASQIISRYGRTQVLEWFLNSLSFGHATIGADSASQTFFGKPASQLTQAEAALLVSVSRSPALNPLDSPQAALENQELFLDKLINNKQISPEDYQKAINEKVHINIAPASENAITSAYSRMILNKLYQLLGFERVELGGLRVITAIDFDLQKDLNCLLKTQISRSIGDQNLEIICPANKYLPPLTRDDADYKSLSASGLIMDPTNGEILAFIGDYDGNSQNSLLLPHQAASILTPLVAVNAFARGFTAASQVWDIPDAQSTSLISHNTEASTHLGPMRLRIAIANDIMVPINTLVSQLGTQIIWQSAPSFGISTQLSTSAGDSFLSKGQSANIIEIGTLYSTFATLGTRYGVENKDTHLIEPVLIKKISTVDNILLYDHDIPDSQSIVSEQLAYIVNDILEDEYAKRLTLGYPNFLELGRPTAAKYGATTLKDEIWTAGSTPQFTSVIWFGNSDGIASPINPQLAGGTWYALMQYLHQNKTVENWHKPAGISEEEVCALSGLLPTRQCPEIVIEKFIDGTQPINSDTLWRSYKINRETGLLATVFTPPEAVEERTFMVVPQEAVAWAKSAGIALPPTTYDAIQSPTPLKDLYISSPTIYSFVKGEVEILGTASGEGFSSYRTQVGSGLNPQSWFEINEAQDTPIRDGLLATWNSVEFDDGLYAIRLQVIRSDQQIETYTIQVSIDNTPPTASIIFPQMDDIILAGTNNIITLQAQCEDETGIQRVEWWLDEKLLGISKDSPYSYPTAVSKGKHIIQITAYDLAGNQSSSTAFAFEVK